MARIALWDNVKFFTIMLVVVGHFADAYSKSSVLLRCVAIFIYTFHMPAFMFVSGLFCRNTVKNGKFPGKKILRYYELFLLVQIINTETIIFVDLFLYEYLIGSANQSVADDNQVLRAGQLEKVFWKILRGSAAKKIYPSAGVPTWLINCPRRFRTIM